MKNLSICASALVCLTGIASADTVNATFNGVSPNQNVTVVLNSNSTTTQAGAFNWTRNVGNPGSLPGFSPTFVTFCIDLTQFISNGGSYAYQTYPTGSAPTSGLGAMGAVRAGYMARLFHDHYNSLAGDADPNAAYAGFQLAVWEIAFDGDLNLTTGNFTVTTASATALARANAFLSTVSLPGGVWPVFAIDDPAGSNTSLQGQMMVPTPGTAALMGLGCLTAFRRRR